MGKKTEITMLSILMSAVLVLGACSDTKDGSGTGGNGQTAAPSAGAADSKSNVPSGPFGKYDPPIEVTTVRFVDQGFKYKNGDTLDRNIWTKIFEEQYGIKVKNNWAVDQSQYRQKLNVSIASRDIPDFMVVNREEMLRLQEAGQLEDLSKLLKEYGSPFLHEMLNQDNGTALKAATFNGQLVGIPQMRVNGGVSTGELIYLRYDWLKKLNLPEPKTIEDVVKIATAFAKNDPDGNGKPDTVGLGVNNELFQFHGSLTGFFNGYKAYPGMWVKDGGGNLAYGSIQPEMKPALEQLAALYKDGVIDREFIVKPWSKLSEQVAAGKLGLAYGSVSDGGHIQRDNVKNEPNADWRMYPIVSADGSKAHPQLRDTADNFYVVKKGAKHPEVMIKLANIFLKHYYETSYAPNPNPFISDADGVAPFKYPPVTLDPLNANLDAFRQAQEALAKGDGSKLGFPASVHYDRLSKYKAGDKTMWFSTAVFGENGSFSVIDYYDKNKLGVYSGFQGAATPTMSEKMASLEKMQTETITKIIMGQSPLSEFDAFVKKWKELGGDQITKEVNAWYSNNK